MPPVMLISTARAPSMLVSSMRAGNGLLGGVHHAVFALADADAHVRQTAGLHHRAHIGKVQIDQRRARRSGRKCPECPGAAYRRRCGRRRSWWCPWSPPAAAGRWARPPACPHAPSDCSMPYSALRMRWRPSNRKGLETTPMVRMPISRAISAMTGAAPVPVPPPMPQVTNTRSAALDAPWRSPRGSPPPPAGPPPDSRPRPAPW